MENKEDKKDYCYFCDPETRGKFTWIGVEDIEGYDGHDEEGYCLEKNNCLYAIADDPYCGTGALKINYCPICGRYLNKETNNA